MPAGVLGGGGGGGFLRWGSVDVKRDRAQLPAGGASATHLALGADPVLVRGGARPARAGWAGRRGRGRERRPDADALGMEPPVAGVAHEGAPQLLLAAAGRADERRESPARLPRVRRRQAQSSRKQPGRHGPYGPKRSIPQLDRAVEP